ncbi:protein LAZY 1-like [Miscanthus floridulus]|uniref:protein LAZY 1-like n=1 Tax=Miscanthus floridulus TaxID=154761 RepID=UPI0034582E4A
MKLLGWMHRKLRQNSNDVFKEFNNGGGGTCNCITGLASPDPATFLASANEYFAGDHDFTNNHSSPPDADLFTFGRSGLLTIGTLGIAAVAVPANADNDDYDVDVDVDADSDSGDNDDTAGEGDKVDSAVTPTFTYTATAPPPPESAEVVEKAAVAVVEAIAEKDDDTTTEDDLMVVSAELEKVLGGRNSGAAGDLVASARVSFAMGGVDCPLQGFLFGSPVSDAESRLEQPRDSNGGRRTSLGELFMRTRFADEKVLLVAVEEGEDGGGDGAAGGERDDGKPGKGGGFHKTMKKRRVKDEKVPGGDGAPASAAVTKSKFQKILQIFHRKVYPESAALVRNLTKKRRRRGSGADEPAEPASSKLRCRKEQRAPGFGCCANRASFSGAASPIHHDEEEEEEELNSSKSGHWIKTDAEYLVLEL